MRNAAILLMAGAFLLPSAQAEEAASSSVAQSVGLSLRKSFTGRLSYLTSWAGGRDFRSFRSSGGGEDEGPGETMPNLNYFSGRLSVKPFRAHELSLGVLQSLDSAADRSLVSARGRGSALPERIVSLRYSYSLSRAFSLKASSKVISNRFSDPSLGASYKNQLESGWGQRASLSLSVPTTEKSRKSNLITRASARAAATYAFSGRWEASAGLSHSRPFHSRQEEGPAVKSSSATRTGGSRRGGARGASAPVEEAINDPSVPTLQEVDLVMAEREVDRSTGSFGLTFEPNDRWKLGAGAGLTYLQTARRKAMWLSSARLLDASYRFLGSWEAGADLRFFSDVQKYREPSLPRLWSVGVQLSYVFGGRDT